MNYKIKVVLTKDHKISAIEKGESIPVLVQFIKF